MKFSLKKKKKAELKDENYRKCLEKWIQKEKSTNSAKKEGKLRKNSEKLKKIANEKAFTAKRGKLHKVLKKWAKPSKQKAYNFLIKKFIFKPKIIGKWHWTQF